VELNQVYCKKYTAIDCRLKASCEGAFAIIQATDYRSFVREGMFLSAAAKTSMQDKLTIPSIYQTICADEQCSKVIVI